MKLHPDWNNNGSVAVTFDDDDDDASETYSDFSKLMNIFNVNFTTFKLRGSKTASMVIPLSFLSENTTSKDSCDDENINDICATRNDDDVSEVNESTDSTDNVIVKKKKKKIIN
jgi:hypothetical protein